MKGVGFFLKKKELLQFRLSGTIHSKQTDGKTKLQTKELKVKESLNPDKEF